MLAAVGEGPNVSRCRMSEEDEGQCGHMPMIVTESATVIIRQEDVMLDGTNEEGKRTLDLTDQIVSEKRWLISSSRDDKVELPDVPL